MTSSKNSAILLLTALIAAILFALYYYIVTPKLEEVNTKESSINSLQQEISTIEKEITIIEENRKSSDIGILALRKKVPQTRAMEEVIRNIEEIEAVTGTRVENVDFNNYDSLVIDAIIDPNAPDSGGKEDGTGEPAAETEEQATTDNKEETATPQTDKELPISTILKESLPEELKLVTFSIDVAAKDSQTMLEFLKEIEKIERVMKIDALDFKLVGEEAKFQEDVDSTVNATVQVTTFYYEGQQ